ncbi:SUMF1/EgtB/PvdO family nonheme iron enzyme [Candidatus Fermentibacteria bacterium]|nr:SUMF1/EgtB/PvdO family nonheme iron enzyme [Candidatus Fermentibacteria bacterium]
MRTLLIVAGLATIGFLLVPRCAKEPTALPAQEWIDLLSPTQGTTWTVGDTASVTWTSRGTSGQVKIELSRGGSSWTTLGTVSASANAYDWVVTGPEATGCRVRVSDSADGSPSVQSGALAISEFHSLLDMVSLSGGTFQMGSTSSWAYSWEQPVHQVTVSAFSIAKDEVTQAQYQEVMGTNPSYFQGANRPVEQVTWWDAAKFCNALSAREGLTKFYNDDDLNSQASTVRMTWSANGYRLPTEAEWEYACRAGSTTDFYNGNLTNPYCEPLDPNLDLIGWYCGNSNDQTHDVGGKQPNTFGLYDMSGNVWEWCNDWYGDYSSGSQTDPTGPSSGSTRVRRGGSWYSYAQSCRSAYRYDYSPGYSYYDIGFRLVRR